MLYLDNSIHLNLFIYSPGPSHIVPVLVGDAALAKQASDTLLADHGIYVQSINYPTVAVGEERLRITPTPGHSVQQLDYLVKAVNQVFDQLEIRRMADWKAVGGRAGVGVEGNAEGKAPVWNDEQLGLKDGTAPTMLKDGNGGIIDPLAALHAQERLSHLLGSVGEVKTAKATPVNYFSDFSKVSASAISVGA